MLCDFYSAQEGGGVSRVNIGPVITASVTSRHTSMIFKIAGNFLFIILQKMLIFRRFGNFFCLTQYDTASLERAFGVSNELEIKLMQGLLSAISLLFCFKPKTSSCHVGSILLEARPQFLYK